MSVVDTRHNVVVCFIADNKINAICAHNSIMLAEYLSLICAPNVPNRSEYFINFDHLALAPNDLSYTKQNYQNVINMIRQLKI